MVVVFQDLLQVDVCKQLISREQRREAQDALILQGHETVLFWLKLYGFPHRSCSGKPFSS